MSHHLQENAEVFEAGGVVNIRLVSDHETGKPKGFAFVEYEDAATALSAIRNLNGFECNGRALRVNFSNNSSLGAEQKRGERAPQQERTVKSVVSQMSAHEVYDVVSNMKQMVEKEPDKAKQMFVSHPQVAEALLHMQVRLGMLKADDVPSLQRPPPPPVVGGAIMLGKGAQLPLLVHPMVMHPQQLAMPGPSGTYHPQQVQQQQQQQQQQYQPPLGPPTVPAPAMGWVEATTQVPPPAQFTQQQQPPQVVIQPPPPPPHIPQPQPPQHLQQPQQSQSNWGSQPVAPAVTARAESNAPRDPRDPRNRYNR